ncbi:MAG: hypothetical protein H6650_11990 [Ardenticatenales bacterium]|nr:hypothetical protein [Ardenticatenales bacterium]
MPVRNRGRQASPGEGLVVYLGLLRKAHRPSKRLALAAASRTATIIPAASASSPGASPCGRSSWRDQQPAAPAGDLGSNNRCQRWRHGCRQPAPSFGATAALAKPYTDRGYRQKHNDDLGLIYYNARYYLPGVSRFTSATITIIAGYASRTVQPLCPCTKQSPQLYTQPTGRTSPCPATRAN